VKCGRIILGLWREQFSVLSWRYVSLFTCVLLLLLFIACCADAVYSPNNSFAKAPPRPPLQGLGGYNPGLSYSSDLQGGDQQQQPPSSSSTSSVNKPTRGLSAAFASTAPRTAAMGKETT